jgi:hypothetical protein
MRNTTQQAILRWYEENKFMYSDMLNKDFSNDGELSETVAFIIAEYQRSYTNLGNYPKALMKELANAHDTIHKAREYFENSRKNVIATYKNREIPYELKDNFLGIFAVYCGYLHAEKTQKGLGDKTIKEWYAAQTY